MKKENQPIVKKSDFILAKEAFNSLGLHEESIVEASVAGNFRKYLRDHSKGSGKEFITKTVDKKLKITRIK